MRRALGHDPRVGGEHAGHVGVDLALICAERGGHRNGSGVGAAASECGDVFGRRHSLESRRRRAPCRGEASRKRSPLISEDLGPAMAVSVTMPAWLPVKLCAGTPRSSMAIATSAADMRSPAVRSMSISRLSPLMGTSPFFVAFSIGPAVGEHRVGETDQVIGGLAHRRDGDHHLVAPRVTVRAT